MEADANQADRPPAGFHPIEVEGVGTLQCRNPIPGSAAVLAKCARSKASENEKAGYLNLFVRNHIGDDQHEELLVRMMNDDAPADTMNRVVEAITTGGTARPTKRSSHSVC